MVNIMPKVAIILVNYNGISDTIDCVKSLCKINYPNYDIIIVENASNDQEKIAKDVFLNKNAKILFSERNNGFSDGNNQGIEFALNNNAKYIVLLNNDTVVEPDFIDELVDTAQRHPDVGIVTGNIYYHSQPKNLWYSCGDYNTHTSVTKMVRTTNKNEDEVTFACGCLMLITAEAIRKVGMLDESFFLYSEDTEYCCRMIKNGYHIYWTSKAHIYHKVSSSTGENSDFQQYYLLRNNLLMIRLYSTNKIRSYILQFYCSMKNLIRRRASIRCYLDAFNDNRRRNYGRSYKY